MSGVPASLTSATLRSGVERLQEARPLLRGVVLVIGDHRHGDAIMVEQHAGDARILAGEQVAGGEAYAAPAA